MTMTPEDRQKLLRNLSEAETAYHQLMLGMKASVIVDQNSERVEFQTTTSGKLAAYIQELKRQLGLLPGCGTGPMQVWL